MINQFRGEHYFLSNFYESDVFYKGITYKNNEAAFQAQKTLDFNEQLKFANLEPKVAKSKGRRVQLRPDWEIVKYQIMYEICLNKFMQNQDLKQKLLNTGDEYLEEGNTWGDKIWGTVNGKGKNHLGLILMRVRENIRQYEKDLFSLDFDRGVTYDPL